MGERIDTDAVLHRAMTQNHLEDPEHPVDLEGPLFRTKKAAQDDERSLLPFLLGEGEKEIISHKVLHAAGLVGGAMIGAGIATVEKTFETIHDGDELNEAVKREYGVGACLALCADALPAGFRQEVAQGFVERGVASPGAAKVLVTVDTQADGDAIRAGIQANCRDGQQYALDKGILTSKDLALALKQNPELAQRYENDLAFRMGTDSVIWATGHGQLDALRTQVAPPVQARSMAVQG